MAANRLRVGARWGAGISAAILIPSLVAPSGALASAGAPVAGVVPAASGVHVSAPATGSVAAPGVEQPTTTQVALSGVDPTVSAPEPDLHEHDPEPGTVGALSSGEDLTLALAAKVAIANPAELVAVTAAADFEPGTSVQLRVKEEEHGWSDWTTVHVDQEHGPDPGSSEAQAARPGSDPLLAVRATKAQVRIDTPSGQVPEGTSLALVDAPVSASDAIVSAQSLQASSAGQPAIISRAQWGADESWRGRDPYYSDEIRAGFIHHTASTSNYSPTQAASQIRAIYSYHTRTLGHSDIDYNFVVDRYGRLYEGRYGGIDQPVIGGHTAGFNDRTFAAVVLGNFHTWSPPASEMTAIKKTLARLFAWKLGLYGINPADDATLLSAGFPRPIRYPKGTWATIPAVSSHQTVNYTSCPGDYLQAQLASIRALAAKYAKTSLAPARPDVASFKAGTRSSVWFASSSSAPLEWTAQILSPCSDTPIRTYSGSTTGSEAFGFSWDLRDEDGEPVLPATYTVELTGTDLAGRRARASTSSVTMTPKKGGPWGPCVNAKRVSAKTPAASSVRWGRHQTPDSRIVVLTGRGDAGVSSLAAGVTAAPLARVLGGVLLVTAQDKLTGSVASEIVDRRATEVIIVGSRRVVSADVAQAVRALGVDVERIGGWSDASVAAHVAERLDHMSSVVLVSPEGSPAHSLAGAALAARRGIPVLIATDRRIPNATRTALFGRTSVTVAATHAAVSDARVKAAVGDRTWNRLTGTDPTSAVSASVAVASAFPGTDTSAVVLPTDSSWGWRLAPVAASAGAPLLFTPGTHLAPEVVALIRARSALGSTLSPARSKWLSDEVLGDVHRALSGESVSGDTIATSIPAQPTTNYSASRTNARPEPVQAGDSISLSTTVQSNYTDGSWRPIPAGQAFGIQFKKAGTTSYRTVGTGYTVDGAAEATAIATTSGRWRIRIGSTRTRSDFVEVRP